LKDEQKVFERLREVSITGKMCSVSLTSCFEYENLEYLLHRALSTLFVYENNSLREKYLEMLKKALEEEEEEEEDKKERKEEIFD